MVAIVIVVLFVIFILAVKLNHEQKIRLKEEKKAKDIFETNASSNIYKKCQELNVSEKFNDDDLKKLLVVAKSYGISDVEKAKKFYFSGKVIVKREAEEQEQKALKEARKEERIIFDRQKNYADKIGRKKYTFIADDHEKIDKIHEELRDTQIKLAVSDAFGNRQNDWAFWGGVAEGIGGTGAGISTARNVQQENQKANARAKESFNNLMNMDSLYMNLSTKKEKELKEYVNTRLYDDSDIRVKFSNIQACASILSITKGKNFIVDGTAVCTETFKLLDRDCVLDGTLEICIKNREGQIVAVGYYCAPGVGNMNLSKVGFCGEVQIGALCWADDPSKINPAERYTCEIKPYHLWFIEK